ncbi:hypothetical protein Ahy_B06g083525 [Arachis hypogaea]|uniref:Uncharacterized protein n=1 Tax=Arachis hypogaea TaxID=3818 RepID=A0A444YQ31_ARAHY|nr:hypothetical protein Ahy_B06g083525 [Arachis hypogaea]
MSFYNLVLASIRRLVIAYHLLAALFITSSPQATLLLPLASFCDLVSVTCAITSSLSITIENFLEHRLQTLVFKFGMAKSIHHAMVLIRQRRTLGLSFFFSLFSEI